jgi:hypothetical protein
MVNMILIYPEYQFIFLGLIIIKEILVKEVFDYLNLNKMMKY